MNSDNGRFDLTTQAVRILFVALLLGFVAFTLYGIAILRVSFAVAFVFAFFMNWAVDRLERKGMPRLLAALSVILLLMLFFFLIVFLISLSVEEIKSLIGQTEQYKVKATLLITGAREWFKEKTPAFLLEQLPQIFSLENLDFSFLSRELFSIIQKSAKNTVDLIPTLFANVAVIFLHSFITIVLVFIFLQQGQNMFKSLLMMVPNRYFEMVLLLLNVVKKQITSYLRGLFIQVGILSLIMSTGFYLIGLPFGPLVGIFAATVNLVPYFGPMVGLVTILLVALLTSPWWPVGFLALAIFLFAQLVDNTYIQLRILGGAVKIPPIIALISVFAFQQLLGPIGMVIAIPLAGVLKVTIEVMYRNLKAFRVI